jgi:hypothetical protein
LLKSGCWESTLVSRETGADFQMLLGRTARAV